MGIQGHGNRGSRHPGSRTLTPARQKLDLGTSRFNNENVQVAPNNNSPGHPSNQTKPAGDLNSTTMLSYPLNVGEEPQQGHYITFHIRVVTPAKLGAVKHARHRVAETNKKITASGGGSMKRASLDAIAKHRAEHNIDGLNYDEDVATVTDADKTSNSIFLKNVPTVALKTAISLYMPPSVQVSYESKYGDQEIGLLAGAAHKVIKDLMGRGSDAYTLGDVASDAMSTLEHGAKRAILKSLDVAAPGASALFAMEKGEIITPKMELMFEGIGRRNFNFTFMFIPKSSTEAKVVQQIILHFKRHMSADFTGGSSVTRSRTMAFPDQFDIEYMHMGAQNTNLNKIARCALTKMDVEYGGDRYVAYEDGVPQTTKLTLSFTEFEIITRSHIEQGF